MQYIVFDTETTGVKRTSVNLSLPSGLRSRGDEVCQIGGFIANEEMVPVKAFCHFCDTIAAECSEGAAKVNGLSMVQIRQYVRGVYLSQILVEQLPEFFADDTAFIGYNADFDMDMTKQTIANTNLDFQWKKFVGATLPTSGRWSIDIMPFLRAPGKGYNRKLSSFDKELQPARDAFFAQNVHLQLQCNCMELFAQGCGSCHNSFYDALNTFLLWRDRVWQKKLI